MASPANDASSIRFYQRLLTVGLIIGVLGVNQGRLAVENSLAAILEDKKLKLDQISIGKLLAWGNFFYFLGKTFSGFATDNLGGRTVFVFSILISGIFCAFLSISSTFMLLTCSWCICKLFVSANWPSMTKIISLWFSSKSYGEITGIISTSSRIGHLLSCFITAELLRTGFYWRTIIMIIALLQILVGLINYFIIKESPSSVGLPNLDEVDSKESTYLQKENPLDKMNWSSAVMYMLRDRAVWLMLWFVGGTTVLMELQSFLPLFLRQYLKMDVGSAVYASCSFQVGSIGGVIFGGYLYDRLSAKRLTFFLNFCMIVTTGSYIFYWKMLPIMDKADVFYTLFVIGFFLSIPYYLPISIFSMVYGGQKFSGTLISLLECLGFLLTMTFDYYAAVIVKLHGWSAFFEILAVTSIVTTGIFFLVSSHPTLITRKY